MKQLTEPVGVQETAKRPPVLYAEYARMLLVMHAAFTVAACLLSAATPMAAIAGAAGAAWIALRAAGGLTWRWFIPGVTMALLILLAWTVGTQPSQPTTLISYGLFSCRTVLVLLALTGCVDVAEAVTRINHRMQVPETRVRTHDWLVRHGLRILLWGTVCFLLAYSIIVPLIEEFLYQQTAATQTQKIEMDRLTLLQNGLFRFCEAMSGMWFFVVGCCVGSFLNVVIYRVPLGISVLAKSSHCPQCSEKIENRDNLPLIGWLKLQGQCRNCGTDIPPRYPLVELTVGLLFLLLYFVELISGGINLPGRTPNLYAGALWILFYTKWDLMGLYLFHCFVLCALLSWTMMQRDGNRVPVRAVLITAALVIIPVLIWPHLLPFAFGRGLHATGNIYEWTHWTTILAPMLRGAIVGLVAGMVLRRYGGIPQHPASWMLVGLALGWPAVIGIGLLCLAAKLLLSVIRMFTDGEDVAVSGQTTGEPSPPATSPVQPAVDSASSADGPGVPGHLVRVAAVTSWWLFPVVLVVHQCFWRPLAILMHRML